MEELAAAAEQGLLHGHAEARERFEKEGHYQRYLRGHHRTGRCTMRAPLSTSSAVALAGGRIEPCAPRCPIIAPCPIIMNVGAQRAEVRRVQRRQREHAAEMQRTGTCLMAIAASDGTEGPQHEH